MTGIWTKIRLLIDLNGSKVKINLPIIPSLCIFLANQKSVTTRYSNFSVIVSIVNILCEVIKVKLNSIIKSSTCVRKQYSNPFVTIIFFYLDQKYYGIKSLSKTLNLTKLCLIFPNFIMRRLLVVCIFNCGWLVDTWNEKWWSDEAADSYDTQFEKNCFSIHRMNLYKSV